MIKELKNRVIEINKRMNEILNSDNPADFKEEYSKLNDEKSDIGLKVHEIAVTRSEDIWDFYKFFNDWFKGADFMKRGIQ